jgi:hypothetical protein|tara:strand:+ start:843 stop:1094 length:252 start_codon:yes stop_codon:yes gene_type:complete
MTAEDIVIAWIKSIKSKNDVFYSYDLEGALPLYGRLAHQKQHTASTYARAFRKIRESNTLRKHGIKLEEVEHKSGKVKGWKIG